MLKCTLLSVGVDIGDRSCEICVLDPSGEVLERAQVPTTPTALQRFFSRLEPAQVALEVGTHSPWVSRLLAACGHKEFVANPRKLRAIWDNDNKNDRNDAHLLAEILQLKPSLLKPVQHRKEAAQLQLAIVRARAALVRVRTMLVNHVRCAVKSAGGRIRKGDTNTFHKRAAELPDALADTLRPLLECCGTVTAWIRGFDKRVKEVVDLSPEMSQLDAVPAVGPVVAMTFVNTLEDPHRFPTASKVASYVGMRPRRDQSGDRDRQLGITKAGDVYLRQLLVQSAQLIIRDRAPDSDLKRWGRRLAERGGKNAKKRAVVAVARKLAVLLWRLWRTGAAYEPLRNANRGASTAAAVEQATAASA